MSQNIYDKAEFFAGYSAMRRSIEGLDGAAEWPAVRAQLPDLTGKRVVDLGCGFGWFARYARSVGAASVLGLDISRNMIARAKTDTQDEAITYGIADLEELELTEASFDFAHSSLAFHYVRDFGKLVGVVHRALVPGARFVFTIEHPVFMAPVNAGWSTDADGRRIWPLDSYAVEGSRTTDWLAKGVVKYHRRLGTTINALISSGFSIRHVEEWAPGEQDLVDHPEWAEELDRPTFLLVSAER